MGRPYPGHRVARASTNRASRSRRAKPAEVACQNRLRYPRPSGPHPVPAATGATPAPRRAKFTGDWCRTGDLARMDEDGYLWYAGRSDDRVRVGGLPHRPGGNRKLPAGPSPRWPMPAVVPKPDTERGALVKAYVVLTPEFAGQPPEGIDAGPAGPCAGNAWRAYEYPKEIEFIDELPMTTTGKVQRRVLRLRGRGKSRNRRAAPSPPDATGEHRHGHLRTRRAAPQHRRQRLYRG